MKWAPSGAHYYKHIVHQMNILIKCNAFNTCVDVYKWALVNRGHKVSIDHQNNFPFGSTASFKLTGSTSILRTGISENSQIFDVVLSLDTYAVTLDSELSVDDQRFCEIQSDHFLRASDYFYSKDCFQINPVYSYAASGLKPYQLKIARDIGFLIPETLISNDYNDIRSFVFEHQDVIYKPFEAFSWRETSGDVSYIPATRTNLELIDESRESLALCPMIFQKRIEKLNEVRVVVFGETILAVELEPANGEEIDWRVQSLQHLKNIAAVKLPSNIEEKILALCKRLSLVYATIDLVLNTDGDYVFLEVNNIGKFLWLEDQDSGYPILDIFCKFIESKNKNFYWDGNADFLLEKYLSERASC